jgi:hypothetical protein
MSGQILQRGKRTFVVRVFLGRSGGKRKYLNKTVHASKKVAENTLTALLRERDLGTLVEPTRLTVDEYLDEWLKTAAKPRVRLRTYQGYEELLTRYIRPDLGPRPLSRITPLEIQAVYAKLLEKKLSARTVRHAHGCRAGGCALHSSRHVDSPLTGLVRAAVSYPSAAEPLPPRVTVLRRR